MTPVPPALIETNMLKTAIEALSFAAAAKKLLLSAPDSLFERSGVSLSNALEVLSDETLFDAQSTQRILDLAATTREMCNEAQNYFWDDRLARHQGHTPPAVPKHMQHRSLLENLSRELHDLIANMNAAHRTWTAVRGMKNYFKYLGNELD